MLRVALVGCGVIAPTHVRAFQELSDRVAITTCSDIDPERAHKLAREFSLKAVEYSAVLADPMIDIVSVCVPSGLHAEVGAAALRAGKHVIVEKPMDITPAACDLLLAAQEESGKTLAVVSQHRFDHASALAKQSIECGELGPLILADARVPWYRTQDYYDSGEWRGTWALDGGGCLMNQGVHTLDLMRWLCGPVRTVYAQARTAGHERIEVEDALCATLTFDNGAIGTLMASTSAYPGFAARLAVHGRNGSAVIEGDRLNTLAVKGEEVRGGEAAHSHALEIATGGTRAATSTVGKSDEAAQRPDPTTVWGEANRLQFVDFIDAIEQEKSPLVDGHEGRRAVELVDAIYRSVRSGEVVHLS